MDKYEFNIKVEQIKKLVTKGDFETSMKIADTIDWRRVRNANLLAMISQVYEKNGEYQEAKEVLLLAFERAPIGKRLLYKLTELALKEGSIKEAEDYYREFCDLAPDDSRQYLLRYMILKEKGASADQLIHPLERYVSTELDEKWLYELASLYAEAGMQRECVQTCDRIMLMFGLGKYVDKAMELKVQYAPLSEYQLDLVENREKYEAKLKAVEQEFGGEYTGDEYDGNLPDSESEVPTEEFDRDYDRDYSDEEGAGFDEEFPEEPSEVYTEDTIEMEEETQPMDEALEADFHEAHMEQQLAREMSRFSEEDYPKQEPAAMQTKILRDMHNIKPVTQMAAKAIEVSVDTEPVPQLQDAEEITDDIPLKSSIANHLMIEAKTPEKGLQMAIDALKKIHLENNSHNQVVKISGSKLSQKGIWNAADKLMGKDLIVEEAGDLSGDDLADLQELISEDTSGMVVVLIDNPRQMEELHQQNPELASLFECIGSEASIPEAPEENIDDEAENIVESDAENGIENAAESVEEDTAENAVEDSTEDSAEDNMEETVEEAVRHQVENEEQIAREAEEPQAISVVSDKEKTAVIEPVEQNQPEEEEMDLDEFADYACKYASEIDCSITGKSMLALYERIEIMEEDGIPLTRANAEELIEEAADKAEKPSLGRLITGVFSSKYDKDGLLILKEEHFI